MGRCIIASMGGRHVAISRWRLRSIRFGQRLEAVAANALVCFLGAAGLFIVWGTYNRQNVNVVPIGGAILMGLALICVMLIRIGGDLALHADGTREDVDEGEADDKTRPY